MSDKLILFPPFTLDTVSGSLWRGTQRIALRPKSRAVLGYLLQHPHRLVTKEELIGAAWPNTRVADAALKVSIAEIRKALGDNTGAPKLIETVGRAGYRFTASVTLDTHDGGGSSIPMVGRQAEIDRLSRHLKTARGAKRQVVFVTGEPGIGKTTLIETFLKNLQSSGDVIAAQGQCIEQYGASEAYLPILDLIERLCRLPSGNEAILCLRCLAPSWLQSLPALVRPEERAELAQQTLGTTPERRQREIAMFLEEFSRTATLVLVLEDVHWLDPSTLALLAYLARRREAARLLVLATYREAEVEQFTHPLKNIKAQLQRHKQCAHLRLKLLAQSAVGEYLSARFETAAVPARLLSTVYRRSEGNPLFMVNVTDYLVGRAAIVREQGSVKFVNSSEGEAVPETIRDLIERQLDGQSREDQELLEAASVAGTTFVVAAIARALGRERQALEEQCRELARREQFLQHAGSRRRPNGRGSSRYSFLHALYQNVIYQRIAERKRAALHQFIGERLEVAYEGATDQIAAELALHFERGGDDQRAVQYLLAAAQRAVQQNGYQEAIAYGETGLARLRTLPKSAQRNELEMSFHLLAGVALASAQGYASAQGQMAFANARRLSSRVNNETVLSQTLAGIWSYRLVRGEIRESFKTATAMVKLAQHTADWAFMLNAHMAAGLSYFYLGDLTKAHSHLDRSSCQYDLERMVAEATAYSWDPGIVAACYHAMTLQLLGYPAQAERQAQRALEFARQLSSPYHPALANGMLAMYYTYRGDVAATLAAAENAIAISSENGYLHWLAVGTTLKGWAMVRRGQSPEGMSLLDQGIVSWQTTGAEMLVPTFRLLQAEAYLAVGDSRKALALIDQCIAMSQKNHETYYDAELYRLRGETRLGLKKPRANLANRQAAEADFLRAIRTAKSQQAKSLELRATMSLCRLWQKGGKEKEAKRLLAKISSWFTEGFDMPDLKAAKELLNELT